VKRNFWLCIPLLISITWPACAQQSSQTVKMSVESVNAALVTARAATREKRFADSEALMLKATASHPEMVLPWIELGLAQLGLKNYDQAENSFRIALGSGPVATRTGSADDFYEQPGASGGLSPGGTHVSRDTFGGTVDNARNRTPEILGVAYSSLGEIYAHAGKTAAAQAAFDAAVKAFPSQAALYRRNETIFFFQAANSDAQLAAAEEAIPLDPGRAMLYYFKGQALASKASVDPQTQKMILPPGCAEAYQKYLQLEPNGQFANDAKSFLADAGLPIKGKK
jgi:tetratricopeptide (TPR) repeat protein